MSNSPLRYPGGKSALADVLRQIRKINSLGSLDLAEPFAGGGGASLSLLYGEDTPNIVLNDADPAVFDFWWSVTKRPDAFLQKLESTPVDVTEWERQREIYRCRSSGRFLRGFSAFFLNRCNRSGIIMNGGPIGGVKQLGNWKIDARYNKSELRRRLLKIAEFRDRIRVSGIDALDFIEQTDEGRTFFFIDPPYYHKGSMLYLNLLTSDYHSRLATCLKNRPGTPWILTYDDCDEIPRLYSSWAEIRPFTLRYAAAVRRKGQEILITPKWMSLPEAQQSNAIGW